MNTIRQVTVNTVTGWGSVLTRTALAFYMVPFLLGQMGRSGYGIAGLLGVLVSLTEVADLGLRQALGRELAEQVARDDRQAFNELANTGFLFYMAIGSLLAVGSILFAPICVSFFRVPVELQAVTIRAVRIYGTGSFVISFVTAVFTATLTSSNRFDVRNNIESVCTIIINLSMIPVIKTVENGLMGWVFVMLAGQLLTGVLLYVAAVRTCPWLSINIRYIRKHRARSLLQFGWKVYVLQLTNLVAERADPPVISRYFGPAGVALYSAGSRLSGVLRPIVLTLSAQLHPLAVQQHVESSLPKQQRMLIDGTRYTLLMGVLFSVILFVYAEPFCALWLESTLGNDYLIVARIARLWAIVDLMVCTSSMQWPMMLGARRLDTMMLIHGIAAILNIILSVYFAGYTSLGISGVLVGTIVSSLILRPLLICYGSRVFKIPVREFFKQALLRPLLLTSLLLPAAYAIRYAVIPTGYLRLILSAAATSLTWLALMTAIALKAQERQWAIERIRGVIFKALKH